MFDFTGGWQGRIQDPGQCLTFGQMMAPNPGVMSYYILQLFKGINNVTCDFTYNVTPCDS